jgi:FAD synthetase
MTGKRVLVGGCFDILHYGHYVFLKNACSLGAQLIIALEPDERIRLKHREPVHTQSQRAEILSGLRFVHEVIQIPLFTCYEEYLELVKQIQPDIIAVTQGDPQLVNKQKQAQQVGAKVEIVTPLMIGCSSSTIMDKLCS